METPPPQPPQDSPSAQPAPEPQMAPPTGPSIRFDTIGTAFSMVFADAGTWIVAALFVIVAMIVVTVVMTALSVVGAMIGGIPGLLLFSLIRMAVTFAVVGSMTANF